MLHALDPKLSIRKYEEGDEELWLQIVNKSFGSCPGFEPRTHFDFKEWRHDRNFDEKGLFFALIGDLGVGTISASLLKHLARRKGRISDLAVLPAHRGKGVGSALLDVGLRYLEGLEMDEITALSWNSSPFLSFYRKHGFKPERRYLKIAWDINRPLPELEANKQVDVREATTADIQILSDLASRAYLPYWDWWYEEHGGTEKLKAFWRERVKDELSKGYVHFIAFDGRRPVGFSTAQIDKASIEERRVKLGTLWGGVAVLPEFRRKHIGARLLMEALGFLKRNGMEKAMVGTFSYLDSNAPAVNLYLKSGGRITTDLVSLTKTP